MGRPHKKVIPRFPVSGFILPELILLRQLQVYAISSVRINLKKNLKSEKE